MTRFLAKCIYFISLLLFVWQPLSAKDIDPASFNVLRCMAAFEFDFVAEELGFSIALLDPKGKEIPRPDDSAMEQLKFSQALKFIADGRLTPRGPVSKKKSRAERALEHRCQILAESVIEIMALKGHLEPSGAKTGPAPIEQSL